MTELELESIMRNNKGKKMLIRDYYTTIEGYIIAVAGSWIKVKHGWCKTWHNTNSYAAIVGQIKEA